ncbi:putative glutaredoxin-like protein NrdH [Alteracholeplasma palmae J233]|uniref:Putative glutaredoxin-like protein NrdH n=1 Tax=Alteracholeplasma palmae (strain ATCC 49389 / J233) TaxID=1318466 RepID=U4KR05_ALTPJ|nr:thioredoxin family protein [Alteracholeplasma palmae]CCV63756.1 putative glutaredoxin-like protein NrdH [Alteracholeplasma palmae J233]
MSVIMITKDNCPQCNKLKMFLKLALNNKYEKDILIVNRETNTKEYEELTSKYQVLTLPAMIAGDEVLTKTEPSNVVNFLEKHIGKK